MPKIVELRQNRNLIRTNFDGYKLSLDNVPIIRSEDLKFPPFRSFASDAQYSFLHTELFSKHNFLVIDPWLRNISYFINTQSQIIRNFYDKNTGSPQSSLSVYEINMDSCKRISGDYNYSMKLISENYCVLCDGINELQLLQTGDRSKGSLWKKIASCPITNDNCRNFLIFDCRLDTINEKKIISCALGRVQKDDNNNSHKLELYCGRIYQDCESNDWKFTIIDKLEGKGSIYYCAFEPRAEALVMASNKQLQFHSKIDKEKISEESNIDEELSIESSIIVPKFHWQQTGDDVTIKFKAIKSKKNNDYVIKCVGNKFTIKCGEEVFFGKELFAKVDQDLTTWTIENNFLQVTLVKQATSIAWPMIFKDGSGPEETISNGGGGGGEAENSSFLENKPIANLEAPIEDCDFPIDEMDYENRIGIFDLRSRLLSYFDPFILARFHLPSLEITHQIILGRVPPLFSTYIRPGFPPALATRQDIDACIWLQQYNPSNDEWSMRHEGNLHAFGYVQASKQEKKFIDCSPDLSYAIIVESHRHVFLYRSDYDTATGLRYRLSGSQISIGKQHLITLDDVGEVLGVATDVDIVTLLTEKCILYLRIN